jgi:hypothetical protein
MKIYFYVHVSDYMSLTRFLSREVSCIACSDECTQLAAPLLLASTATTSQCDITAPSVSVLSLNEALSVS